jgi:hypothetical protein
MKDFEKLGAFYLGREVDLASGQGAEAPMLYDARDLVTHAVIVGMTGSGKTGLGIALLEEAAIDGVPALILDPKGDLGNLLLTFPDLAPADFRPWINEDDARRKGLTPDAFAEQQAKAWREGLAAWGQDGERIRRLREAADFAIYTPGSSTGRPLSILASFDAPPADEIADADLYRGRVATTAASLLGLLGIDADPVRSREHILLSHLFDAAWRAGRNLDLGQLIRQIQTPPIARVGVLEVDTFFAPAERFTFATQVNNLLASPSFQAWTEGEPLDVQRLLFGERGKPCLSVLSIAHLGDAERMFFVSLLLNQLVSWMRRQSGTTSLRALLYMDEVFGYLPPTANPSSKLPLLTLLKQARAYGLGIVLATQNPVDLDYKALSNAGTWFLGRLQTERDKARVMEGLEGVSAGAAAAAGGRFDRQAMEKTLAGLASRVFLMNNVHDDGPVVMETRWVMSYLRGPLTPVQIRELVRASGATSTTPAARTASGDERSAPVLPAGIRQLYGTSATERPTYLPHLYGAARIHFSDAKAGVEHVASWNRLLPIAGASVTVDWSAAAPSDEVAEDFEQQPEAAATFATLPRLAADPKSYPGWEKKLADAAYRNARLELFKAPLSGALSKPEESERDFRARLALSGRESRDGAIDALRAKYAARLRTLDDRIARARAQVEKQKGEATQRKLEAAVSFGSTVLGALFGRKKLSSTNLGRAATTARGMGRVMKEGEDVDRANESVASLEEQRTALASEIEAAVADLQATSDPATQALDAVTLKPRKADVEVVLVALAWVPEK